MARNNTENTEPSSSLIKVEASLSRIIFPRDGATLGMEDSSFGITSWEVNKVLSGKLENNASADNSWFYNPNIITVKGIFFETPDNKAPYTLLLVPAPDDRYGMQYELKGMTRVFDLGEPTGAKNFLLSILTPLTVKELYKTYANPIEYIQNHDISALLKVRGIGRFRANKLIEYYEDNKDYSEIYAALVDSGLTTNFIGRMISFYHSPQVIIQKIKKYPYSLCFEMDGVGFLTADKIALKNGFSETCPERVEALVYYRLTEWAEAGYSWVTATDVLVNIYETFGGKEKILEVYTDESGNVTGTNVSVAMQNLVDKGIITIEENKDRKERRVYLTKYHDLERDIAMHIKRLQNAPNHFNYQNWGARVKEQEAAQGFAFTDEQWKGIKTTLDNQVCFITGSAGAGKSATVAGVLHALQGYSFAQVALSGRAAARLQEITGEDGMTIHRLLGYRPPDGFAMNADHPLSQDIIILDEVSLVGGEIFLRLLEAIPNGTKLIMLGDMGQLEALGSLNIAHDIFVSPYVPTVELTKIHRQAAKSGIITVATDVRQQVQITSSDDRESREVFGELQDFYLETTLRANVLDAVRRCYLKGYKSPLVNQDPMKIQIVVTQKERGNASVKGVNELIQGIINPPHSGKAEIIIKVSKNESWTLRNGDKVMCVKNQYNIAKDLYDDSDSPEVCDIFNGWFGRVTSIVNGVATIFFPALNDSVMMDNSMIRKLIVLGYCSTVHKCQGSGFPVVVAAIDFFTVPTLLTKEMIYTAITRAEKQCYLVAENGALRKAISNTFVSTKQTFLQEFLADKSCVF